MKNLKREMGRAITTVQKLLLIGIIISAGIIGGSAYWYMTTLQSSAVKQIKVGAVFPLSGSAYRSMLRDAPEFYVNKLINDVGGIESLGGTNVTLVWADCQNSPDLALSETERLITQEGVVCVLGSYLSSLTYATQEVCERHKVPCLSGLATSPSLLQRGYRYFFSTTANDDTFGKGEVDFAVDSIQKNGLSDKVHKVAILSESAIFGQTARTSWLKYIGQANSKGLVNWTIVDDISFATPIVDITAEVIRLKSADPDLLFVVSLTAPDTTKLMDSMLEQDFYPPIVITMDAGFTHFDFLKIETLKNRIEYFFSRFAIGGVDDQFAANPKLETLKEAYTQKYGYYELQLTSQQLSIEALKYGLEEAGKTDPKMGNFSEALASAFRNIYVPRNATGLCAIDFNDTTGYNELTEICMGQMLPDPKNSAQIIWQTVWPQTVATTQAVIPDPRSRGFP